jgi:NADH dehydrogenase
LSAKPHVVIVGGGFDCQSPTEFCLDARTVIWAGGVAASPLGRAPANSAGAETNKSGRIKVGPDLTLPRFRNTLVIGTSR